VHEDPRDALITKYAWPKTVHPPLRLIVRIRQWACCCYFCIQRMPISRKWISATNRNINYAKYKGKNSWCSVDPHSKSGAVLMVLSLLPIKAAITSIMNDSDEIPGELRYLQDHNHWHSIDAHFNVLSIQHLLPSMIVFLMVWLYWLSFGEMETRWCGKAERSTILALCTLTWLKMICPAKRFIAPAIPLFLNRYSQATAHCSPLMNL